MNCQVKSKQTWKMVSFCSITANEKVFAKNVEFRRNSSSSKTFEWIEKQNLN